MPTEPLGEGSHKGEKNALILEVGLKHGEVPVRIPVTVQNFSAGLLTLKVTQSLNWVDWETLTDHDSHLRLPEGRAAEAEAIPGKVSWVKTSGPANAPVFLGMEISQPSAQVQQLLENQVLYTPKDIKDMWQQWDQVQVQGRRSALSILVILICGISLILLGGSFLAAAHRLPENYGYGALAAGSVLIIFSGIRFWWRRRV